MAKMSFENVRFQSPILIFSSELRWSTVAPAAIAVTFLASGSDRSRQLWTLWEGFSSRVCITFNCHLAVCIQLTVLVRLDQIRRISFICTLSWANNLTSLDHTHWLASGQEMWFHLFGASSTLFLLLLLLLLLPNVHNNNELLSALVSATKWFG